MIAKEVGGLAEVSWLYSDDRDIKLEELFSQYIWGTLQSMFGGTVDREARIAIEAGHTANVDDPSCNGRKKKWLIHFCKHLLFSSFMQASTFTSLEQGQAVLGDPEGAQEVDVDLFLNLAKGLPIELAADTYASIVDQSIQAWNTRNAIMGNVSLSPQPKPAKVSEP